MEKSNIVEDQKLVSHTEEESEYPEKSNNEYLLYLDRTKDFIRGIGVKEGLEISFKEECNKTLQNYYKLITAVLSYELIEELKRKQRKRVNNEILEIAFDNILSQSDALNVAIENLNEAIEKLKLDSKESSLQRATDYLNFEEDANDE
ncbi:hypothetical protein SAMN04487777_12725 [Priestia aryabhattai B8W22]|uniref:hypothetical protein n=1 Tax=Priestia aryabhattai TaxID=412384 RepID=UPI00088B001E|nr:hypothetical protein SAMN04487777_12725 [Priestia aryabhattai B8W22]